MDIGRTIMDICIGDKMATQKVYASYQEIIDLHTEHDRVSAIGIHTPTGDTPKKLFGGFFDQFKKYKYLGCSITLVPAARLPVDPMGVSYEPGELQIDPRDLLNPILWHGCHGQDMGAILNQLYTAGVVGSNTFQNVYKTDAIDLVEFANIEDIDLTFLENLYYKALTDNTWKKAHPQKGFKKSGLRPLVYSIGTTHQIMPTSDMGATIQDLQEYGLPGEIEPVLGPSFYQTYGSAKQTRVQRMQLVANRLRGLGWLDTRNVITTTDYTSEQVTGSMREVFDQLPGAIADMLNENTQIAELPKLFMGVILLPPAYKTEQYFRMIVNHRFAFAGFRGISFQNDTLNQPAPSVFNLNDAEPDQEDDDETAGIPETPVSLYGDIITDAAALPPDVWTDSSTGWTGGIGTLLSVYNEGATAEDDYENPIGAVAGVYTNSLSQVTEPIYFYQTTDNKVNLVTKHGDNYYYCIGLQGTEHTLHFRNAVLEQQISRSLDNITFSPDSDVSETFTQEEVNTLVGQILDGVTFTWLE